MRVVKSTADELVIRESPWFLAIFLILFSAGLVNTLIVESAGLSPLGAAALLLMAAVTVGVVWFCVRFITVAFLRPADRIEVRRLGLGGDVCEVYALRHFAEAREDRSFGDASEATRVVLAFREEMAGELDPVERARFERLRRRGLRRADLTEIPLTVYFSGGGDAARIVRAINDWAKGG